MYNYGYLQIICFYLNCICFESPKALYKFPIIIIILKLFFLCDTLSVSDVQPQRDGKIENGRERKREEGERESGGGGGGVEKGIERQRLRETETEKIEKRKEVERWRQGDRTDDSVADLFAG